MHFTKVILFFIVVNTLLPHSISAQFTCGSFTRKHIDKNQVQSNMYDRFGNAYTAEELTLPPNVKDQSRATINTGFFNLQFFNFPEKVSTENHPNFGEDLRPVIEQVFADLSEIIIQRNQDYACNDNLNPQKVNVNITSDITGGDPNIDPKTSSIAGVGSPYFILTEYYNISECNTILESSTWNKINSRGYYFANFLSDGVIGINLDNINIEYETDWSSPPATNKIDLYSVVLHEAMHMLGFASKIDVSGSPTILSGSNASYYSRYDQLLLFSDAFDPSSNPSAQNLIEGDCIHNCFDLNTQISDFESVIGSSCGNGAFDIFIGDDINAAVIGTNGNSISTVNGLSHLDEACSNEDYVMDPGINRGEAERTLSTAELKILCKLGYAIKDGLIPGGCDDCFASANFDHPLRIVDDMTVEYIQSCCFEPLATTINEKLIIDLNVLLCNDFPRSVSDITDIFTANDFGTNLTIERLQDDQLSFQASKKGIYPIYYTVKNCDCYLSTSFFMVEVSQGLAECNLALCDNLICQGDFESLDKSNDFYLETDYFDRFIFEEGIQNTPDICEEADNNIINLINIIGPEGLVFMLEHPIQPGCTMHISAELASRLDTESALNIFGSEFPPCFPSEIFITKDCNVGNNTQIKSECGSSAYIPFCIVRDESIDNKHPGLLCPDQGLTLENHQWSFINETNVPLNYLVLYNSAQPSAIWMDNLTVTQSCPPLVTVDFESLTLKVNQSGLVDIKVCFSDDSSPGFNGSDVLIGVTLPQGLNFDSGGDFNQGQATIQNLQEGECVDLELSLVAEAEGEFIFDVTASVAQLCSQDIFSTKLIVEGVSSISDINMSERDIQNSIIKIFDLVGNELYNETYRGEKIQTIKHRLTHLPNGMYLLCIQTKTKIVYTEKIPLLH